MNDEFNGESMSTEDRNLETLINDFCDNILIYSGDILNFHSVSEYIDGLTDKEHRTLTHCDLETDCLLVDNRLSSYLQYYQNNSRIKPIPGSPFDFDSGGQLNKYKDEFIGYYKARYSNKNLPSILEYAFKNIQDMSVHYRIFVHFYSIRSQETEDALFIAIANAAKNQTQKTIAQSIESATKRAKDSATEAAKQAKKAYEDASAAAKEAAKNEVDQKINELTKSFSETSVTILGMFTGVVLAVVAGLFYSSSVLDNINSTDYCKLISVSAFVGFVCYSLIALMFRYIERIKYKHDTMPRFNKMSIVVCIVLLVITFGFGVLQYFSS